MSHLGRWLSALVDGELDEVERDRVLNHVAGCEGCRREANAMRALKRRLTALGDTCAESAIAGKLIELGGGEQDVPVSAADARRSWRDAGSGLIAAHGPWPIRPGWKLASGSASVALMAIGLVAFMLGSSSAAPPVPKITPSVDSYLLQHSRDWPGEEPAGPGPIGGSAPSAPAGRSSASGQPAHGVGPARLDPSHPGTAQFGQLREPVMAGSPGPVAAATTLPQPRTSATASPVAGSPVSPTPSPSGAAAGSHSPSGHPK